MKKKELLHHLQQENQTGVINGLHKDQTGVIEDLGNYLLKNFNLCDGSSLHDDQKNAPNGTYFIKNKEAKTKFFIKKDGKLYSCTTTLEFPKGIIKKEAA